MAICHAPGPSPACFGPPAHFLCGYFLSPRLCFFFFGGRIVGEVCVVCVRVALLLSLVPFVFSICACCTIPCWLSCEDLVSGDRARPPLVFV